MYDAAFRSTPPPARLTPGGYLRASREAAGLGLPQAAANLAALPFAVRPASPAEVNRLALRLAAAEQDSDPFTRREVELVRNAFDLDPDLYLQLVDLHLAAAAGEPDRFAPAGALVGEVAQ